MSGPKIYSPPPPMYSAKVFDGQLNAIFDIQIKIKNLIDQLKNLACYDDDRGIRFDAEEYLEKNRDSLEKAIEPFSIKHSGLFGQSVYNRFREQIQSKNQKLSRLQSELESQKIDLEQKKEDYEAYLEYEAYFQRLKENFHKNKLKLIKYLEKFSNPQNAHIISQAQKEIEQITIDRPQSKFTFGFRQKLASEKEKAASLIKEAESKISNVRNNLSSEIIELVQQKEVASPKKKRSKVSAHISKKIEQLENLISSVEDDHRREKYREKLEKLLQSAAQSNDDFFYDELYDDILRYEKTLKYKQQIQQILKKINETNFHSSLQDEKLALIRAGLDLLERNKLGQNQIGDFLLRYEDLQEKSREKRKEEDIREREKLFLKQQLITSLQSMGYEVVTETEVVDFSAEGDFLFKIPDQENYLNLRFLADGTILYNFLIPEDRAELSIDQTELKLLEMKQTCEEFKSLLAVLSKMGLSFKTRSEKPVDADALICVPAKFLSRIKAEKKKKAAATPETKRRYLE